MRRKNQGSAAQRCGCIRSKGNNINFSDYIVHTHAKDGKQLKAVDTRTLYCPQYYNLEPGDWGSIIEMPLGAGNVDWANYLKALEEIGYNGYLTIERECGENPAADIALAANFLREKLSKLK